MAVDPTVLFVTWLRSIPSLQSALAPRSGTQSVYGTTLPSKFDPKEGIGLLVALRGGKSEVEIQGLLRPRFQVTVFGEVFGEQAVGAFYSILQEVIDGKAQNLPGVGVVMSCLEEMSPNNVADPGTGWATAVTFYNLIVR